MPPALTGCTAMDGPCGSPDNPEATPPNKQVLKLHARLQKAGSSVLIQARTGRIGLGKFLYNCKVPGVLSVKSKCGAAKKRLSIWLYSVLKQNAGNASVRMEESTIRNSLGRAREKRG
jgi:hypothetical protein